MIGKDPGDLRERQSPCASYDSQKSVAADLAAFGFLSFVD
jgi:hypothetical protein